MFDADLGEKNRIIRELKENLIEHDDEFLHLNSTLSECKKRCEMSDAELNRKDFY